MGTTDVKMYTLFSRPFFSMGKKQRKTLVRFFFSEYFFCDFHLPWTGWAYIPCLRDTESCILPSLLPDTIRTWSPKLCPRSSNTWLSTRPTPFRDGNVFDRLDLLLPCSNDLPFCLIYSININFIS